MDYTPTIWKSGDTVTSAKLNKLERGVEEASGSAGVFWVNITTPDGGTTWTADKTVDEVIAAVQGGQLVYANFDGQYVPLVNSYAEENYADLTFTVIIPNGYDPVGKKLSVESTRISYGAEGTATNLAVETGAYSFSVSKTG